MKPSLTRRLVAEFLGTCLLVAAVVGSGIMGERLSAGNVALALLCNAVATGAVLVALILTFGSISGAHFNPVVTLSDALEKGIGWNEVPAYMAAQILGGICGTFTAHLMFSLPLISLSRHNRSGGALVFSEFVATFGLLSVIWGCSRLRSTATPFAVGAYITAAYWFTASTSFANPAVTIARSLSNTFSGIEPQDVLPFIIAQIFGGISATLVFRSLIPNLSIEAKEVLLPHHSTQKP
jgi:glycerol uptake facilitator-like aquaporin